MGQKTHPRGFRLGIVAPWKSRWYAERDFPKLLAEDERLRKYLHQRLGHASLSEVPADARRAVVLLDSRDFDLQEAALAAQKILSRHKKGYFLMVEGDTHTDHLREGLDKMAMLDRTVASVTAAAGKQTLVVFTADHSFDIRLRGGLLATPLLTGIEEEEAKAAAEKRRDIRIPAVRMDNGHTGEAVMVAAQGPGAERVRGFMDNTDVFRVMMQAFGWKAD